MHWLTAVDRLRAAREPGVLVTLASTRGHSPRDAGAKMVVSARETWGSIGGGNLEATAVDRARRMIEQRASAPEQLDLALNDKARTEHGRQCCGGEVGIAGSAVRAGRMVGARSASSSNRWPSRRAWPCSGWGTSATSSRAS